MSIKGSENFDGNFPVSDEVLTNEYPVELGERMILIWCLPYGRNGCNLVKRQETIFQDTDNPMSPLAAR